MGAGARAACRLSGGMGAQGDAYDSRSHTHAVAAARNTTSASRLRARARPSRPGTAAAVQGHCGGEHPRPDQPEAGGGWDPALPRAVDEVDVGGHAQSAQRTQQRARAHECRQLPQPHAVGRQRRRSLGSECVKEPASSPLT